MSPSHRLPTRTSRHSACGWATSCDARRCKATYSVLSSRWRHGDTRRRLEVRFEDPADSALCTFRTGRNAWDHRTWELKVKSSRSYPGGCRSWTCLRTTCLSWIRGHLSLPAAHSAAWRGGCASISPRCSADPCTVPPSLGSSVCRPEPGPAKSIHPPRSMSLRGLT